MVRSYRQSPRRSSVCHPEIGRFTAGILSAMARPWLVPPAAFNPEGISWAVKYEVRDDATPVAALYECTTSEPAGIELAEWEVPPAATEADAIAWLGGFMPDADAVRISREMVAALAES